MVERTMTTATLSAVTRYVRRLAGHELRGLTDGQLLDRFARDRDEAAFAELVRRHGPMVLGVCRRILRHEQDAEDAFQAAFVALARKAGAVRRQDCLAGWLYRVARRLALRSRAAAVRRQLTPLSDAAAVPTPLAPQDRLRDHLDEELERLPEQYRAPLVLCYLEGRSQAEAARLLATTAGAVNSRLERAREALRQRLARRGLLLSGAALAEALTGAACAALPPTVTRLTARAALTARTGLVAALARGALHMIATSKLKILSALALAFALLILGGMPFPPEVPAGTPAAASQAGGKDKAAEKPAPQPGGKDRAKPQRSVILLWMSGGPSQIDTFDPKPKDPNGALFRGIDTVVKGVQISEALPKLAKLANHLTILRTVTHREGDHGRGTYLMRTGRDPGGAEDYPALAAALGKELGEGRPDLPRYVSIAPLPGALGQGDSGAGFLGREYGPLVVAERNAFGGGEDRLVLPPAAAFERLAKGRGDKLREAVAKAFDLAGENREIRAAYGGGLFGQGCLLARRLVEKKVPVVEVTLPGWDTHTNAQPAVQRLCDELDAALSALLKDLHERKLLETTLVVWMGEFGRTPRINPQGGRDHWPKGFSVVLAGCGAKGGTVVGKTAADGIKIEERPVTVPELLATICQAVGVDPARENRSEAGRMVPLVEKGTKPVKEALR
jgi:RNA polymerase sigma factor (sigma-70 family)